jgi:hypothetical protein
MQRADFEKMEVVSKRRIQKQSGCSMFLRQGKKSRLTCMCRDIAMESRCDKENTPAATPDAALRL